MPYQNHIPRDLQKLYEIHERGHAAAILAGEFPEEFADLCNALRKFRFTKEQVMARGRNESEIPKTFSRLLRPRWSEAKLTARLVVDDESVNIDTHKIDYCRGRVALDVEWNSKDQTFDRDLYSFRAFHEFGKISVGVLVTRSEELIPWFNGLGTFQDQTGKTRRFVDKYAASTTHMGQLLRRLNAGRGGGCPMLAFGITTKLLAK